MHLYTDKIRDTERDQTLLTPTKLHTLIVKFD